MNKLMMAYAVVVVFGFVAFLVVVFVVVLLASAIILLALFALVIIILSPVFQDGRRLLNQLVNEATERLES